MKQLQVILSMCTIIVCIVFWSTRNTKITSIKEHKNAIVLNMGVTNKGKHFIKVKEPYSLGYTINHLNITKEEFNTINIGDTIR